MQFEDFCNYNDYKHRLMEDLLTNGAIVRLLTDDPALIAEPLKLVYSQVFPYEYVPNTVEHGQVFICCDVDVQKALNKTYLLPTIYIWVFAHKSKLRLPDGSGVRTDKLSAEVIKTINGSRMYGLGELDFFSSKRFAPISDYQGKQLTFNAVDFNRLSPTGKPIPERRKRR